MRRWAARWCELLHPKRTCGAWLFGWRYRRTLRLPCDVMMPDFHDGAVESLGNIITSRYLVATPEWHRSPMVLTNYGADWIVLGTCPVVPQQESPPLKTRVISRNSLSATTSAARGAIREPLRHPIAQQALPRASWCQPIAPGVICCIVLWCRWPSLPVRPFIRTVRHKKIFKAAGFRHIDGSVENLLEK